MWRLNSNESLNAKLAELPDDRLLVRGEGRLKFEDFQKQLQLEAHTKPKVDFGLADELARLASETGRIFVLEWLRQEGVWQPEHSGMALQAAEEAGNLMLLLVSFQLPLARYPYLAQAHLREAQELFNGDLQTLGLRDMRSQWTATELEPRMMPRPSAFAGLPRSLGPGRPTPEASLLANFLLVPSPAAEDVMERIVEDMVVFQPQDEHIQARKVSKASQNFPQDLNAIYVSRICNAGKASRIQYDPQAGTLRLPQHTSTLRTTEEYWITLTSISRKAALIPDEATKFAYVYYGDGFPTGGFLYCDKAGIVLAVNAISFSPKKDAFSFGEPQLIGPAAAKEIATRAQEVDEPALREGGAKKYAWVGPGEVLADGAEGGIMGGFAYLFENPRIADRFFPIIGAGKVVDSLVILRSREESLRSLPERMNFPETLGAIYLQRETTIQEGQDSSIWYDEKDNFLRLAPDREGLRTSPLYDVTLTEVARRAALIPLQANKFAYIYYGEEFATGGFLYIGRDTKPIAVNSISFLHRRYALSLGGYKPVGPEASQLLQERSQAISVAALQEKGAERYAWVGPGEKLADFVADPGGGFVYLFDEPAKNRYFPIDGAAEVVDRAVISGELSCALLPNNASGSEVERRVTCTKVDSAVPLPLRQRRQTSGVPVRVARLKVPGVLHPVVLHGLACTPRAQVLETTAAKAIAQAAYMQARWAIALDFCFELMSLTAVTRITHSARGGKLGLRDNVEPWERSSVGISLAVIILVWLKNVQKEIVLLLGYRRWAWTADYFTSHKAMGWAHLLMMIALVVLLILGLASRFRMYKSDALRPLLAAVGCMTWVRLLYAFRGVEALRLGKRILPILAALGEVKDFLLIMLFFFGACVQASFALSEQHTALSYLLFSAYRMGFLGDFDTDKDVLFLQEEGEEKMAWSGFQYSFFVLFSFVLAVAMTNIFIGVMSNAFDYHQEKVGQLFVRTRACIGLDYALLAEGYSWPCCCGGRSAVQVRKLGQATDMLWFCYRRFDEEDEGNSEATLRGALRAVSAELTKNFDVVASRLVEQLEQRLAPKDSSVAVPVPVREEQPPVPPARQPPPVLGTRRLEVIIIGAKGLRDADMLSGLGTSDSYCTCEVLRKPNTRVKTGVCSDVQNPSWMYQFQITDFTEKDSLKFEVWDQDLVKQDDLLGAAALPFAQILSAGGFAGTLPLAVCGRDVCASLDVEIRVEGEGPAAPEVPSAQAATRQIVCQVVPTASCKRGAEAAAVLLPGVGNRSSKYFPA